MKTEIVVARYNENLDWLKKIKKSKDIKITIYNKGKDDINIPFIRLPNIGRESHTYLYHIINNYNNLADQTIFCQGDSIFHSPNFLDLINKYRKKFEPVQPLSAWYWPEDEEPFFLYNPPKPVLEATKNLWIDGKAKIHVEYMDNSFITLFPFHYVENNFIKLIDKLKSSYNIDNALQFNVERFRLKNVDLDYLIPICFSAIFSINKEAILDNSIDFYNNIMSILIYDVRQNYMKNKKMDHGLFLEKLWLVIFNYRKYNKNYLHLKVKDYNLEKSNLTIKKNIINFSYFNHYCQIFIEFMLDNDNFNIFISKYTIYIKKYIKSKNMYVYIYVYDTVHDKKVHNILKDSINYNVLMNFNNNILNVNINNKMLFEYNFDETKIKYNTLKNAILYDVTKSNKFVNKLK